MTQTPQKTQSQRVTLATYRKGADNGFQREVRNGKKREIPLAKRMFLVNIQERIRNEMLAAALVASIRKAIQDSTPIKTKDRKTTPVKKKRKLLRRRNAMKPSSTSPPRIRL